MAEAFGAELGRAMQARAGLARRAAIWSVVGPLIWLPQAALIAAVISYLLGQPGLSPATGAAAFAVLAILRALVEMRAGRLAQDLAREVQADLRASLIDAELRRAPAGSNEDPGGLASLMGEQIGLLGPWIERYRPAMLRARMLPLVILAAVFPISWAAGLGLLLTGPLIPLFMALVGLAAETTARAHLVEAGALNRMLIDRIAALPDLRILGAAGRAQADLALRSDNLRDRTMRVLRLAFLSSTVLEFFAALGVALMAVHVGLTLLGWVNWGSWGGLSAFGAVFILLIAPDFYQPMRDLAGAWHDRAAGSAAAAQMDARLAGRQVILGQGDAVAPAAMGALHWQAVQLSPGPTRQIAVPDGHVAPGEAVALTGPSGAGKSSLLAALAGLAPLAAGQIRLGDLALDTASADAIRGRLALMPQQMRFPATSLRRFLGDAPEAVIRQALREARAAQVVAALPQGLATRLGETGGGVSGGEARRLMLARALVDPPGFLLADEPTADLDDETAAAVTDALLALRARGTGLLIATHDPALIARLDRRIDLQGDARKEQA